MDTSGVESVARKVIFVISTYYDLREGKCLNTWKDMILLFNKSMCRQSTFSSCAHRPFASNVWPFCFANNLTWHESLGSAPPPMTQDSLESKSWDCPQNPESEKFYFTAYIGIKRKNSNKGNALDWFWLWKLFLTCFCWIWSAFSYP